MVLAGATVTVMPPSPPGFQVYTPAPLAVSTTELPAQIEALLALILTVGAGFTTTCTVCVVKQPMALLPVTE